MASPASILLSLLFFGIFFVASLYVLLVIARKYNEKYFDKYSPNSRPMTWWYWFGCAHVFTGAIGLLLLAFIITRIGYSTMIMTTGIYLGSLLALGVSTVRQTSRTAFLALTIWTLNPIIWIINGIYLGRRWDILEKNEPDPTTARNSFILNIALIVLMVWHYSATNQFLQTEAAKIQRKQEALLAQRQAAEEQTGQAMTSVPKVGLLLTFDYPKTWQAGPISSPNQKFRFRTPTDELVTLSVLEQAVQPQGMINSLVAQIRRLDPQSTFSPPELVSSNGKEWVHLRLSYLHNKTQIFQESYFHFGKRSVVDITTLGNQTEKPTLAENAKRAVDGLSIEE